MTAPYIDPKLIFASNAPAIDRPPAFANYDKGMDETRKNNGRPTIKQFNFIQQQNDNKFLYIHEQGAALPYKEGIEYAEGAIVLKDGELQQLKGGVWESALNKGYWLDYYKDGKSYPINARIMLDNGDIVKSTINGNVNNPNSNSTGWLIERQPLKLNSVTELPTLKALDGEFCLVYQYIEGNGGGLFYFIKGDTSVANSVNIISGDGGNWYRANWKNPTIYDAGLNGSESDATAKFQALVDVASSFGFDVDLCGKEIKITALDIPSNTKIKNGTLNALSSTWQNTYGRAALMLKNTNRNAAGVDYERNENYSPLDTIQNITFEEIVFKADTLIGIFFKFKNMNFIRCKGYWNQQNLFKLVGGWHGTPLTPDTPTSYNLVDPINGRCEYITEIQCDWFGGYRNKDFSSPFRYIACGKATIIGGINDSPLGRHIDIYNKDFTLIGADYINSNQAVVDDTTNGTAQADMLALYVGQNSYGIRVLGGLWRNFGKKGLYAECCSQVTLDGVNAEMTIANNVASFADLQPNWKENTNTIWGNVADITIKNCTSKGTRYGIQTTPFGNVKSLKNIDIINNQIITTSNFDAVSLVGVDKYLIKDTTCKGNFSLGPNNTNGVVRNNEFANQSNYALYISDLADGDFPECINNDFIVSSGSAIYNNGGSGKSGSIVGGKLKSGAGSQLMQLGTAANIVCYDFENGVTQRTQSFSQNISVAAGATTSTVIKSITGVREGWIPNLTIHGIVAFGYDLTITCSAEVDGVSFKIKNNGSSDVNFTPNMLLKLNSLCDPVFRN